MLGFDLILLFSRLIRSVALQKVSCDFPKYSTVQCRSFHRLVFLMLFLFSLQLPSVACGSVPSVGQHSFHAWVSYVDTLNWVHSFFPLPSSLESPRRRRRSFTSIGANAGWPSRADISCGEISQHCDPTVLPLENASRGENFKSVQKDVKGERISLNGRGNSERIGGVDSLPDEIPLQSLKTVVPDEPPAICGSSSSSEELSEDERDGRERDRLVEDRDIGRLPEQSVAAASDGHGTLALGKNFHKLSLAITEPEADDDDTGDKEAYMAGVLARYRRTLVERTKYHLGYPYNLDFNYQALSQLQHFSINNLGDPFIESNYGVHSRQFEVGVLDWFARLWDIEKDQYWGYITNCGTEGNLHGILVGREVYPDGILYASKDSHYSVFKAARMYRMEVVKVETLLSGEIDCNDLEKKLRERADKPAILNVNIGTTVKGAVDDLDGVLDALKAAGFSEDRFFIHCDGALFGLMIPFVKKAPRVSFKKPIGSVSVSGHKFIGCPMPCGIQITRIQHIQYLSKNVEYLASKDATIMGSRNGHAPLFLWYTLNRKGYRGFQKEVQRCLRNAHYLKDRLRESGFGVMLNELSSTVVFERPKEERFVLKWQLACQGSIAHAVVMPSVSVEKLDKFVDELIESRSKYFPDGKIIAPCISEEVGPGNCACGLHLNITPITREHTHTSRNRSAYGDSFRY